MTEDFKTYEKNEKLYKLATSICEFYSSYDPYGFFDATDKFLVSEDEIQETVEELKNPDQIVAYLEQFDDVTAFDYEALSNEQKRQLDNIVEELNKLSEDIHSEEIRM